MNKIFEDEFAKIPMTVEQLKKKFPILASDITRIEGNHCYCPENEGEFEMLPEDDEAVIQGGKQYMKCRKCDGWSHL